MATLLLGTAGAAIGGALLPSGLSVLGATVTGAAIGGAIGSLAGSYADAQLFGRRTSVSGPRLSDLQVQTSSEGAPIPRVWGRARLAGQIIWAAKFKETQSTQEAGKGTSTTTVTSYSYTASFAVGLCEGEITRIGRIWADGRPLDRNGLTIRIYRGTEDQLPDSLIEAVEGAGNVPAYRGLAYLVFENLPLETFGNRVPQLQFEVIRRAKNASLETKIKAVNIIPGSGEFAYATTIVRRQLGPGATQAENMNNALGVPDITESLDQLDLELPNCGAALLTVSWFGNDLRCGVCEIRPGVENAVKVTEPVSWSAGGATRATAHVISGGASGPNFGGTPSDQSIVEAIQALKARGLKVLIYPFILMDVPAGNGRPSPYNPLAEQSAFPWRGRITCHPAAGVAGTVDKSAAAMAQVAAFFGTATPAHFSVSGTTVSYSGPSEWSFRRFILHLASLSVAAGGVDGFVIGSELRGLTSIRDSATTFPAVTAMKALAADVRAVLGVGPKITYAADWTEYFGYQPADGSGDVFFHLDPLWADSNIDAVGIDYYAPLSDWREGSTHPDAVAGHANTYSQTYLKTNIESGENHSWYYASGTDRVAQTRTTITDGAYGEPWVFRAKDLRNWWLNAHYNRPGGVRSLTPTAWTAQSKPFWLTELGCPAVDKGANQPNVFYDPKSSESALPFFSSGRRDDVIQRQYIQAMLDYWDPVAGNNPVSGLYSGRMIDMARVFVWAWDARPYPEYPLRAEIWSDSGNWEKGHWINGRMGLVPVGDVASELCAQAGITDADTAEVSETLTGFVVNDTAPPRAALEALGSAYHLDLFESAGTIRIRPKGRPPVATIVESDLALSEGDAERFEVTRAQETDLPPAVRVAYSDAWASYRAGLAEARRPAASCQRIARLNLDLVLESAQAQGIADRLLAQAWASRETVRFVLAPSKLALEPGDTLSWAVSSPIHTLTVTDLTDAGAREIEAQRIEPSILLPASNANRTRNDRVPLVIGPPTVQYLDLPLLAGTESPHAAHAAAFASPWPGRIDVHEYLGPGSQVLVSLTAPAIMGETTTAFYAGPEGRWDDGNAVWVKLYSGTLSSRSSDEVLNGANAAAIRNADGRWEVFQFRTAELTAPLTYKLSGLLRGQAGTEAEMRNPVAAGAIFVLMNSAVRQLVVSPDNRNRDMILRAGPGNIPLYDARYVQETARFEGLGLRPLSPVHVAGRRDGGSGDVTITWVRRTRIGGDVWDGSDVPLNEPEEAYQIEILNGGTIIRTLTSTGPQALYTAAMQITDWGSSSVSPITVSIAQTSGAFGVGQRRTATLYV